MSLVDTASCFNIACAADDGKVNKSRAGARGVLEGQEIGNVITHDVLIGVLRVPDALLLFFAASRFPLVLHRYLGVIAPSSFVYTPG